MLEHYLLCAQRTVLVVFREVHSDGNRAGTISLCSWIFWGGKGTPGSAHWQLMILYLGITLKDAQGLYGTRDWNWVSFVKIMCSSHWASSMVPHLFFKVIYLCTKGDRTLSSWKYEKILSLLVFCICKKVIELVLNYNILGSSWHHCKSTYDKVH